MYKYYNANALKNRVNDCVVRAISLAEDKSWDDTYKELSTLAQKDGILLDDVRFVEDYLDDRYDRQCHTSKTVGEFIEEHPIGIYLITMDNHITCLIDGTIFDTFDCTSRVMRCAWLVQK